MYKLRLITKDDSELIHQARNSDAVRPFMCGQGVIDAAQHMAWMEKKLTLLDSEPYCLFVKDDTPIGVVGISQYDAQHGIGEYGFYLFAEGTQPGTGTAMLVAFCEYAMQHTNMSALTARVKGSNVKSLRLHDKLGFTRVQEDEEGIVHFMLTRASWREQRARFAPQLAEAGV
ncbi:MAG: N-acetyltransferase [Alphaproteobacteria bacterium]|nr:N-acetyltransferase [Alphaproteobacteria bacterium]